MWIFCEILCAVAASVFSIQISKFVSGIFKLSGKRLKKFQHKVEIYFSMYSSPQYAAGCWPAPRRAAAGISLGICCN